MGAARAWLSRRTRLTFPLRRPVEQALDRVAHEHPSLGWGPGKDHGIVVYGFCR